MDKPQLSILWGAGFALGYILVASLLKLIHLTACGPN